MKIAFQFPYDFFQQPLVCRTIYFLLLSLLFQGNLFAQPYYLQTYPILQYLEKDVSCGSCQFVVTQDSVPHAYAGISFGPDGHLYLLSQAPENRLYQINVTTGTNAMVYADPDNNVQMGGLIAMGGGIFYSIPNLLESNDSLYLWDTNVDTVYAVGELPYKPYGDMWMANGVVYYLSWQGSGLRRIIKTNLSSPEDSEIALEFSADYVIYGLTATPVANVFIGTENSFYYPGKHVVTLNLSDGTITKYCKVPKPANHGQLQGLSSMAEHADVAYLMQIDLDCDDSSGATGDNFNGSSMNCFTEGGVPIADEDIIMFIDSRISTMTISIANPLDAADEVLTLSGSLNGIFLEGEGTGTLILSSEGGAKISDFMDALKLVRYDNIALSPTGGMRNIEVFFETELGNTCDVATAYVFVEQKTQIVLDLGPDVELCEGSSLLLDAGDNQLNYLWSTGETTSSIEITEEGTYSLTISGGIKCPNSDEVIVTMLPNYLLELNGDSVLCAGEDVILTVTTDAPFPIDFELTIEPGSATWYYDIESGFQIIDSPLSFTDYVISSVISDEPACFTYDLAYHSIGIEAGLNLFDSIAICAGDSVLLGLTWEDTPGDYSVIHPATIGCDTVVTYTLSLNPTEQEFAWMNTCDSSLAGISVFWKINHIGCDTMVTNTVTWIPPDTTLTHQTSCRLADEGVFMTSLTNQFGCDSLIVTTVSWTPPADTTFTSALSCDSTQIGIYSTYVTGQLGCDSLIMHSINFGIPDTTLLSITSCDPSSLGVFISHLTNAQQCDSTVITTVSFSAQDSVFISGSSCDPGQAGVFVSTYTNQFGCDSIVTQTIDLLSPDEIFLFATTCDPNNAGVFTSTLINQFGCDSILHETVELLPQDEVLLFSTTCSSSEAGIFISTFANQNGCDSIITETITLVPIDTTKHTDYTCHPMEVKTIKTVLTGLDGCDSIVIESIELFPLPNLILESTIDYNGYTISCKDAADGIIHTLMEGTPPYQYIWSEGSTTPMITDLSAGVYAVTVTDGNGCTIIETITLTEPEPVVIGFEVSEPDCFDQQQGSVLVLPLGGVGPYTYSMDSGPFQASALFSGLGAGVYLLTAADANDCRSEEILSLNMPVTVDVELGDDLVISSGDSVLIHAVVNLPFDSLASLVWIGIDSSQCPTCPTQVVTPIITTAYFVTVTNADGCSDSDSLEVVVTSASEKYIPNVFSPNGDGINDVFTFTLSDETEEISSFSIFDRWGNMAFTVESILPSDPARAWNGTLNGQTVNPGVFTYKLILRMNDGHTELHYGNITLLR